MPQTIRLTVISGLHKNDRFCFRGNFKCEIGRATDCDVSLTGTDRDRLISRRHCQLEADGPCIHVRDLHSANGTFINGKRVESFDDSRFDLIEHLKKDTLNATLEHGDILTVGGTTLRVEVMNCHMNNDNCDSADNKEGDQSSVTFPIKNCPHTC